MKRIHLLAAEIFKYSYANYEGHLGINERFDRLMPEDAKTLEQALNEGWSIDEVAGKLDISSKNARELLNATREAIDIVDADDPAESFRKAVRLSIHYALEDGINDDKAIENLVTQICYRAADLGYLLDQREHKLSQYSRHLRTESDVGYYEGYFDEPFKG